MKSVILKTGKEKSLIRKHPWIFSGAIQKVEGKPVIGENVIIKSSRGEKLAVLLTLLILKFAREYGVLILKKKSTEIFSSAK